MKTGTKIGLAIGLSTLLAVGGSISYIIGAKFTAEKYENAVFAQDESMQNTWGMMEQSLKMQGFTVKNYGKAFIDSIQANAKRYENDKGGMMKWVQESQNQMSPEIHKKFMMTIEKVYARKEAKQLSKISVVQEYRTFRDASVKGFIATSFFSYPTAKCLTIEDRIISTKGTKKTWDIGIEEDAKDPFRGVSNGV